MNLRKFGWLISAFVVLVLLITACAPPAAAPAAQEAVPAAAKRCEGVKIIFFPGGPPG